MDFLANSLRGAKKLPVETDPEVIAAKAAADLLDNLLNTFNIFFDKVELNNLNKTVDYVDLVRALCQNSNIKTVTIDKGFLSPLNKDEIRILLEVIGSMPKLESLSVHFPPESPLKPEVLGKVLLRIKNLKELHLTDLELTGDEYDMEPLGEIIEGMKYLRSISINQLVLQKPPREDDDAMFPDHIVNPLATLPALEEVVISSPTKLSWDEDSLGGLCDSKTLKSLILENMQLDPSQIGAIAEAIQGDSSVLQHLEFCDCDIENDGWRSLATALPDNKSLRVLDLSQCNSLDDDGCFIIASCMESNTGIKVLKLHNDTASAVTSHGITSVFRMLEKNTSLECLEVCFTADDDSGFKAVADALQRNSSLKTLYIENFGSKVSTRGVVAIGKALETHNKTLEEIGIVFDGEDSDGVLALAQAMQKSPSLKRFAFSRAEYRNVGTENNES